MLAMHSTAFETATPDIVAIRHSVAAFAAEWPAHFENAPHFHDCDQLVFASSGIMTVAAPEGMSAVPPQRAVWMPAHMPHVIHAGTPVSVRTIYFASDRTGHLPRRCTIINVDPLLRELILRAVDTGADFAPGTSGNRLAAVLIDELSGATASPGMLHLPHPADPRVQSIVAAILADPSDRRTRAEWSSVSGASSRTIDRIFIQQTGMSLDTWRRQAMLLEAVRRLAEGRPVTTVAFDAGYESASAFCAVFKRTFGLTPSRLFR